MAKKPAHYVWLDGDFVEWAEAKLHVSTDTVLRGANVFEGIRAYHDGSNGQMFVFRLREHVERLWQSMKVMRMTCPYSKEDLARACVEVVSRNDFHEDVHIRLVAYFGEGPLFAFKRDEIVTGAFVLALPRPSSPGVRDGIACCVSSWQRLADHVMPPRVKAGANYQQSRLVSVQAHLDGYDSAIMLNERGKVSEGPGACLMMVRNGQPITPPVTADILESITRRTLMELFHSEMGLEVIERDIDRTELYIADELFYCGSGNEITPIISVDRYPVGEGSVGPISKTIQDIYFDVVRGQRAEYKHWCTPVY